MAPQITAYTHVGNLGQTVTAFTLFGLRDVPDAADYDWSSLSPEDFVIEGAWTDVSRLVASEGVQGVRFEDDTLRLEVDPFRYVASDFVVSCLAVPALRFRKDAIALVVTRTADDFAAGQRNGVGYRLYTPDERTPRPAALMLFLHGGGEGGTDNWLQLVGTLGATAWVERFPDLMVLAPQNPEPWEAMVAPASSAASGKRLPGWSVETLETVVSVIRDLIDDGEADPERVYVSGMSMGGAGTLRMLAHHPYLFAAAAPICPSMNEETIPYLKGLGNMPVWISSAYRDTFPTRHEHIVEGIEHLQRAGNDQARYTLYSAEELAAFGLGSNPDLTDEQRWAENHHSWVLTLNNAYGIMDWVLERDEDDKEPDEDED